MDDHSDDDYNDLRFFMANSQVLAENHLPLKRIHLLEGFFSECLIALYKVHFVSKESFCLHDE